MSWLIASLAGKLKIPIWVVEVLLGVVAGLVIFFSIQYYGARQRERGAKEATPGIIDGFKKQKEAEWKKIEDKNASDTEANAADARLLSAERAALAQDKETVVKLRASADATLDAAKVIAKTGKEAGYAQALTLHGAELLGALRAESAALAAAPPK